MGKQSIANVNAPGLTVEQREIINVRLNPGAIVSSLVALYLILYQAEVSTLVLATPVVPQADQLC